MTLTQEKIEQIRNELEGLSEEEQQKKFQEIITTLSPEEREQLVGRQQCPFCLMVKGEIPVKKVYEDDTLLGILDIRPANKGHVLLFPKEHHRVMSTVPDQVIGELFKVANKLSTAIFETVGAQGTNIFVANGPAAGQTAPHMLVNIIPRFAKDNVSIGWNAQTIEDNELETLSENIRKKTPREKPKIALEKKEEKIVQQKGKMDRLP